MPELLYKDEIHAIEGAAYELYSHLGAGFLEAVYHEAREVEFRDRGIPFESQRTIRVQYKSRRFAKSYVADLVCWEQIIVELKAVRVVTSGDEAQLPNYLEASGLRVGLLLNFGASDKLSWRRRIV